MSRDERILSLARMVRGFALDLRARVPRHVELDDLIAAGWIGAIHAVDRWDPARRTLLETFARWHIRGAMQDYLRELDHLSRDHRRDYKAAAAAALAAGVPLPLPLPRVVQLVLHSNEADDRDGMHLLGRDDPTFLRAEQRADLAGIFRAARLTVRERDIAIRRYADDEPVKAIGLRYGVGEARASRIRKRAVEKLRQAA